MALRVLTLAEIKAHSLLAEIQALTEADLEPLEAEALDLLEAELGRRLTVDAVDRAVDVYGDGLSMLCLPERLDSLTSAVSETLGDITSACVLLAGGWLLKAKTSVSVTGLYEGAAYTFSEGVAVTVTGKWGLACPDRAKGVLMDVVEALAVRKGDPVSRRDELVPWGSVSDGGLQASRDSAHRAATLENLLRYDVKVRLRGFYRPSVVAAV
ncbi:MAG: hypothetical protein M1325_04400 [Actinobacteria bacterium]|nr:hypothetical protein [Actinomycetota bacterium]